MPWLVPQSPQVSPQEAKFDITVFFVIFEVNRLCRYQLVTVIVEIIDRKSALVVLIWTVTWLILAREMFPSVLKKLTETLSFGNVDWTSLLGCATKIVSWWSGCQFSKCHTYCQVELQHIKVSISIEIRSSQGNVAESKSHLIRPTWLQICFLKLLPTRTVY